MNSRLAWSISIGTYFGVPVRLHYCLFIFISIIFCLQWHYPQHDPEIFDYSSAVATSIVLLVSIVIHELAHVFAANTLGGGARQIVLSPWGGESSLDLPLTKRAQAIVFLAGPFVNAMICISGLVLLVNSGQDTFSLILNPLKPHKLEGVWGVSIVKITTWINFHLFLFNLVPAYPFDASNLVRILIRSKNSSISREKVETGVLIIGTAAAFVFLVVAWLAKDVNIRPIQPTWFVLSVIGITLFFTARHGYYQHCQAIREDAEWDQLVNELEEEYLEDSGYGSDSDSMELHDAESVSQWLHEKQLAREQVEREIEAEEERRVDSILEKLHETGLESLDAEEKSLLDRVSDRYRRRNQMRS